MDLLVHPAYARMNPVILSDSYIQSRLADGSLSLTPEVSIDQIQPASVDVRLDQRLLVFGDYEIIDPTQQQTMVSRDCGQGYLLHPGEFVLGCTLEEISMPDDLVARVEGKSSLGRLGLVIHATAGFIDPGFSGQITLELFNMAPKPILIIAGMKIAQLSFHQMVGPAKRPYGSAGLGSKYHGQMGPTASKYSENSRKPHYGH